MPITAKTKVLGIIGHPVGHSLSPPMQNAALQAARLDYVYVAFPVRPEDLPAAVQGLRSIGVAGFNVTIPHKEGVIPLLDRLSPEAQQAGSVNTVRCDDGLLTGYNTDGEGLLVSLAEECGFVAQGKSVVLLGAGGAARGALSALCAAQAGRVVLVNRTPERAERLAKEFSAIFPETEIASLTVEQLATGEETARTDLVVNTSSVGMRGESFPGFDCSKLSPDAVVYDMVYVPAETPLLAAARERGLRCANGLGMLAAQGEAAFRIWTGSAPPAGIMKKCLREALR